MLTQGQNDPGPGGPSPTTVASALPAGSLAKIDPGTGDASRVIRDAPGLGRDADIRPNLAIGEGGVWMHVWPDGANALLQHFDEATGDDRGRLQTQGAGAGLAVGSRTVWFSTPAEARVYRINPLTHEPLTPVAVGSGVVTDIVLGGGRLWVGSSDGTLTAFDPLTGRRLDEIEIDGTPDALAYGDDSVWVLDLLQSEVIRVDP